MSADKIDSLITEVLRSNSRKMLKDEAGESCPSEEDLAEYIHCLRSGMEPSAKVARHAMECDLCFDMTAQALSTLKRAEQDAGHHGGAETGRGHDGFRYGRHESAGIRGISERLSNIGDAIKRVLRRNRYLLVAAVFFALSFLVRRYFLQFLVAAGIFGFKWVMDTGGSKALIMIYDAWQKRSIIRHEDKKDLLNDRFKR